MGYAQLRQDLRDALSPFWHSNPGIGDDELVDAVRRLYNEFATIDDPWWPRLLAVYMEARAAISAAKENEETDDPECLCPDSFIENDVPYYQCPKHWGELKDLSGEAGESCDCACHITNPDHLSFGCCDDAHMQTDPQDALQMRLNKLAGTKITCPECGGASKAVAETRQVDYMCVAGGSCYGTGEVFLFPDLVRMVCEGDFYETMDDARSFYYVPTGTHKDCACGGSGFGFTGSTEFEVWFEAARQLNLYPRVKVTESGGYRVRLRRRNPAKGFGDNLLEALVEALELHVDRERRRAIYDC